MSKWQIMSKNKLKSWARKRRKPHPASNNYFFIHD